MPKCEIERPREIKGKTTLEVNKRIRKNEVKRLQVEFPGTYEKMLDSENRPSEKKKTFFQSKTITTKVFK
jgi:hypothetical protein